MSTALADYMDAHDLKDEVVAEAVGVGRTTVVRWRAGVRQPRLEHALRLIEFSNGGMSLAELRPDIAGMVQAAHEAAE